MAADSLLRYFLILNKLLNWQTNDLQRCFIWWSKDICLSTTIPRLVALWDKGILSFSNVHVIQRRAITKFLRDEYNFSFMFVQLKIIAIHPTTNLTNTAFNPVFDRGCIIRFKSNVKLTIISIHIIIDIIALNNITERRCIHEIYHRLQNRPLRRIYWQDTLTWTRFIDVDKLGTVAKIRIKLL